MGIFDFWKAYANPAQPLPNPVNQSRDNMFTGYGQGQFMSLLRRALPGSQKDWSRVAGDLLLNSVVATGIDWYIRNYPQAIPEIRQPMGNGEYEVIVDHPLMELMLEPMPGLSAALVWGWIITDYKAFGNAYLRKIRTSEKGPVIGLQYLPQDMVRPVGDGVNPLTHYVYATDGRQYNIPVIDMIHFRYGRDPVDIRIGRSPLQSTLREIATDNMASATAYGLLNNGGIPSILIGPDTNNAADNISPDDARTMKRAIRENLTGDNAGGVVVMTGAYKMDKVSFTPQEMALDSIRRLPEERITAALGLNAMVLGLGAGLERSTYSNYEAAQQAAWEDGMIPTLRVIADTLTISLLPDFGESDAYVAYNFDDVRALADDYDAMSIRAERLFKANVIDRAQAKRMVGIEPVPADEGVMFGASATPEQKSYATRPPFYGFEFLPEE
jgi:HK97 family phage portal protein